MATQNLRSGLPNGLVGDGQRLRQESALTSGGGESRLPSVNGSPPKTTDSKPKILIVDDDADNRFLYAHFLGFSGFAVTEAEDGREGVERAREAMPDLIVMDLTLPVMDGVEASAALRSDARTKEIPIVALTGHSIAPEAPEARHFDAVLVKPCVPEALVTKIRQLLESRGRSA